jgi:hypothetical protein
VFRCNTVRDPFSFTAQTWRSRRATASSDRTRISLERTNSPITSPARQGFRLFRAPIILFDSNLGLEVDWALIDRATRQLSSVFSSRRRARSRSTSRAIFTTGRRMTLGNLQASSRFSNMPSTFRSSETNSKCEISGPVMAKRRGSAAKIGRALESAESGEGPQE